MQEHSAVLKEVIAIIRPQRWVQTKQRLQRLNLPAFTHQRVLGRGRECGLRYLPRQGATTGTGVRYLPKRLISWVVEESQVEWLVHALIDANQTGQLGDGKIFVLPIGDAVRVRTGDRGVEAIRSERMLAGVLGTPSDAPWIPEVAHASRS